MSNFSETRTSPVPDPKRNERGEEGGLRAVLMAIIPRDLTESGIDSSAISRSRERGRNQGEKKMPTCRTHLAVREGERERVAG
jgi:hypothetical protein